MAYVEVRDYVLWPKHIHGDDELKTYLLRLREGQLIELEIDGFCGVWERMNGAKSKAYGRFEGDRQFSRALAQAIPQEAT